MKPAMLAIGAVASGIAFGAVAQERSLPKEAFAQFGAEPREAVNPEDVSAFADARIAAVHAGLKLNPDQEKLWPPVDGAMHDLARQRQNARRMRQERLAAMREQGSRDMPAVLRSMADRQEASAAALRKLADASSPLYSSLTEAQKRRLTMLLRPGR